MLDLKRFKGFAVVSFNNSAEANALLLYSAIHDISIIKVPNKGVKCPEDYVPCGSVEWCSKSLRPVTPDYYPEWATNYLHRNIWREDKWPSNRVFIKPADRYKRFTGFITSGYKKKKKPPFWCSEIVNFQNEWRYYISNGKVLCAEWYWGDEINTPDAPSLNNIEIPINYCGAVDFGILDTGQFALVEANHPFACGWYGKEHEKYLQWLVDGWEYMTCCSF